MISRSRLWSNFLHWRTNQFVSFHKFPQKNICFLLLKFIPSRLAGSYSFAIRYIRVRSKSKNTECVQTQYSISATSSCGRKTQTHHQYGVYHPQRSRLRAWYTYRFKSSEPQQLVWLVGTPCDDVSPVASCEDWNVSAHDVLYCGI